MICTLLTSISLLGGAAPQATDPSPLALPWVFSDHMVLQQGAPIPVGGSAAPGARVTVEFGTERAAAEADVSGQWRVELDGRSATFAGEELIVRSSGREIRFADVVVGDVWLCAGQSNMDFPVARAIGGPAASRTATTVRLCNRTGSPSAAARPLTASELNALAQGDFYGGQWQLASPEAIAAFSAVGFAFGTALEGALDVPIGLIDVSVGGSTTEGWIAPASLAGDPELAPLLGDYLASPLTHPFIRERVALQLGAHSGSVDRDDGPRHFFAPGYLHDHAIATLAPSALRGVLWYQGESNAHLPDLADTLFRTLVRDWRTAWQDEDLPFYFVQLPGMKRPTWPRFREVQSGWTSIPGVSMAVSIDLGHPNDVHPKDKFPIGERLARLALARTYGRDVIDTGPTVGSTERHGERFVVTFGGGEGLGFAPGRDATGFEIAGPDRRYYPATARIAGAKVELTSPEVSEPVAARYAFAPYPEWSLVGTDGLPAGPFRVQPWRPTRVACIGDSITAGHGLANPAMDAYPARLQVLLGDGFDVRNFGHSGTCIVQTTMRGEWPRAFRRNVEHRDALAFVPDVVVSNLGINDIMDWRTSGGSFVEDYIELIGDYRGLDSRPKVLLWSPLAPLFPGQAFHGDPFALEINRAIETVAQRAGLDTIDMRQGLEQHSEWFPDHIHPDRRGSAAIAVKVRAGLAAAGIVASEPRTIRLYVLTGQSNALGTTADPGAMDTSPGVHPADAETRFFWRNRSTREGRGNGVLLGDSGGAWTTLKVQQGEGSNRTFWGPEISFARSLYASGERDFGIVKVCQSGGGNGFWSDGSGDDRMYRLLVDTVREATLEFPGAGRVEVAALLYLQGESDNRDEADLAGKRLGALADNLRRDLPSASHMRVLVAGIAAPGATRDAVRAGQRAVAASDPRMVYTSTLDLAPQLYDGLHFNRAAKFAVGRRLARAWVALGGAPVWRSSAR